MRELDRAFLFVGITLAGSLGAQDDRGEARGAAIAKERREWRVAQAVLQSRVVGLRRAIGEERAKRGAWFSRAWRAEHQREHEQLSRATERLAKALVDFESRCRRLLAAVPDELRGQLLPMLPPEEATSFDPTRFMAVIGVLDQLDRQSFGSVPEPTESGDSQARLEQERERLAILRREIETRKRALVARVDGLESELLSVRRDGPEPGQVEADPSIEKLSGQVLQMEDAAFRCVTLFGGYLRDFEARLGAGAPPALRRPVRAALNLAANPEIGREQLVVAQTVAVGVTIRRLEQRFSVGVSDPESSGRRR